MLGRVIRNNSIRSFAVSAANVVSSVQTMTDKFALEALDIYKMNKVDVDKELDKV